MKTDLHAGVHMIPGSIRTRLVALVAVVVTPFVLVVAWTSHADYRRTVATARMDVLAVADITSAGTAQFLADARRQMEGLSSTLGGAAASAARCEAAVRRSLTLSSFAMDAVVVGLGGQVLCSTRAPPSGAETDVSGSPWFQAASASNTFTVAPPVRGPYSGHWLVPLIVPIPGSGGTTEGFLGLSVSLERFQSLLAGVPRNPGALVTISDGNGRVIARSEDPAAHVGRELPPYPSLGVEVGPNRWLSAGEDFQGVMRTWGRVDIPDLGWHVYAGVPMETVMAPARAKALRRALVVGVILLMALAASLLIQKGIASPLSQLQESVQAAAAGGAVIIPAAGPAEIREVAQQFNRTLVARDEARATAQTAQDRLQSLMENAVVGIFLSAGEERFLHVNPALVEMLGYDAPSDLEEVGPQDLFADAAARQRFATDIKDQPVFRHLETEWLRRDGGRITVQLAGRTYTDTKGTRFLEVHAQDITTQQRFQRELSQTQKMEAVGRLAGGVAHDFNNLLTVISGNLLMALDEPTLPPFVAEEIREAFDASERAGALTRKLLTFSRKDRPEPRVVDGDELVSGIQKLLERLIPEHIELVTATATEGVGVVGDPGQLEQVVMNLVLNARDSIADSGRIDVTTDIRYGDADDVEGGPQEWFVLTVGDNGAGMSEDVRARIFEPFFTTKATGKGTGLGLATVHAIVSQAGGHVDVQSRPGAGTTFQIWLPAVSLDEHVKPGLETMVQGGGNGETVLVVEDEEGVRTTVCRILERAGYQVITADDGESGLAVMEAGLYPVDLVLCDVVMPAMGGVDVARALARMAPHVPVLLMSGYTTELPSTPSEADGVSHFLGKPFTPGELRGRVRSLLDARRNSGTPAHHG